MSSQTYQVAAMAAPAGDGATRALPPDAAADDLTPRETYELAMIDASELATGTALVDYTTEQSIDTLANYHYWTPAVASGYPVITYSFPVVDNDPNTADEPADYIGNGRYGTLRTFSAEQAAAARLAIELWDDLIPLDFVDAGTDAAADTRFFNSTLINTAGGAPAGTGTDGDIWIYNFDQNPPSTRDWTVGAFYFGYWMLHEIGHTLGLSHAGSYPGAGYNGLNYLQDTAVYTLMSYNSNGDADVVWNADMATPMVNDVAAIQFYYGADLTTRTGDTVYGFNSNVTDRLPLDFDAMLAQEHVVAPITIWDAGGIDTLDLSKFGQDADIDINDGGYSNAGGQAMAIGIAYGAVIENAIAGAGHDRMWGNAVANHLVGRGGNDRILGGAGDDHLEGHGGAAADDTPHAPVEALALNQGVTDQYLAAAGYSGLSGASNDVEFTIELLASGLSGYVELISYANDQTANAFGVTLSSNGTIDLTYRGVTDITTVDAGLLTDGSTHRFSLSWLNKAYVIYIDGVAVGSGTHSSGSTSLNGLGTLIFGQEQDLVGGGFSISQILRGSLTDIRIFNDVRTAEEIAANATAPLSSPATEQGLISNWLVGTPSLANGLVADALGNQGLTINGATPPELVKIGDWDNDTLLGGDGNDTLDGGSDADVLSGGTGNDTYHVDQAGDVIVETAGSGHDTLLATGDFALAIDDDIEVLRAMAGSTGLRLAGNGIANWFYSGAGADTLTGGAGNDVYEVNGTGDVVAEAADGGTDTILTTTRYVLGAGISVEILRANAGATSLAITGNDIRNTLFGNAGNDTLNGGSNSDVLNGGAGNDVYYVDTAGDAIVEAAGKGADTLLASASYTLAASVSVEVLRANAGGKAITLTGNANANTLYSGAGADKLVGGAGNDVYHVNATTDVVTEASGGGLDTIYTSASFRLTAGSSVEVLRANAGATGLTIYANELANTLWGNTGNDALNGQAGNDTIYGGAGNDRIYGSTGYDRMIGGSGNDDLQGGDNRDVVTGGTGSDRLGGGAGNDYLSGDIGRDLLTGGTGRDTFDFNAASETGLNATRDIVTDFALHWDVLNLGSIDAKVSTSGNNKFVFIGQQAFHGVEGEVRFLTLDRTGAALDRTIVEADTNGDRKADFQIEIYGLKALTAVDFVL